MADFTEFRLKIEGTLDGVEITPETLSLSRLVEYLRDVAAIMGHKDAVHFIRMEEGSAMPVFYIEREEEERVSVHIQQAQRGRATRDANVAYKRFDARLRQDNAIAQIVNTRRHAQVIKFPGRDLIKPEEFARIREVGELIGEVRRVGGLDETVPIWLRRSDGEVFFCEADDHLAAELGNYLYQTLRVYGVGLWTRAKEGRWKLEKFKIRTFDREPVLSESLTDTLRALRALPGNEWTTIGEPLKEIENIRHGKDRLA